MNYLLNHTEFKHSNQDFMLNKLEIKQLEYIIVLKIKKYVKI